MKRLVNKAKKNFSELVREGKYKMIPDLYDKTAVLKGTFEKHPVKGKENIKNYFKFLTKGYNDVIFDKTHNFSVKKGDLLFEMGLYTFVKKNGEKVDATYELVYIKRGEEIKILTHFSALV